MILEVPINTIRPKKKKGKKVYRLERRNKTVFADCNIIYRENPKELIKNKNENKNNLPQEISK